jgi:hypothetical protein
LRAAHVGREAREHVENALKSKEKVVVLDITVMYSLLLLMGSSLLAYCYLVVTQTKHKLASTLLIVLVAMITAGYSWLALHLLLHTLSSAAAQ